MKKVLIPIGCSGSGKSTWVEHTIREYLTNGLAWPVAVSADKFFMQNGEYKFDGQKLSFAHDFCKIQFVNHLKNGLECVIVDNTNTTKAERSFYIGCAALFGYDVELIYMEETDPDVCFSRNVHRVPMEAIVAQLKRIEENRE